MKHVPVVVGLLLAALLAGGVYWVRARQAALAGPSSAASGIAGPPAGDTVPDITQRSASIDDGDVRVTATLLPTPPRAYATLHLSVIVERAGVPVALEEARVRFDMTMPMGEHRYRLVSGPGAAPGEQAADVSLPWCITGERRWYATVEGLVDGRPRTVRFRFDLEPR